MADNMKVSATGINLATKYESALLQAFTRSSLTTGKVNTEYNWDGVKSIHVYTAITQPLGDYKRSGTWRYGEPTELQDKEQEMIITLDKSFSITVDKGNNDEQMNAKRTGAVTKAEIGEQVTPFFDKYALNYWATNAGVSDTSFTTLDKDSVLDMFIAARKNFVNNNFAVGGDTFAYVPTSVYGLLLRNPEFISVEKLGNQILTNGEVGKCMNLRVVETPDAYLPAGTWALFTHKKAVLEPVKSTELHTYTNVPGISGTLIEGRYRGDAFVLDTLKNGVQVFKKA